MPAFGLIGIRIVIIAIQLQTSMRAILGVDVSRLDYRWRSMTRGESTI